MKIKTLYIFSLIFILSCFAKNLPADDSLKVKKSGIVLLPIFGYAPETKLELGARMSYYFRDSKTLITSRPSTIAPRISYTQNKQIYAQLAADLYFQNEKYHIIGDLSYYKYPDLFYGIGNNISTDDEEDYTPIKTEFLISFQRRIFPGFNIGAQYEYRHLKVTKMGSEGLLATGNIFGSDGGLNSGLSLLMNWDTRDNIFYPLAGAYYQLTAGVFDSWLGSDYKFNLYQFDLRKYFSFIPKHALALQGVLNVTSGDPPFNRLMLLGSDKILRGYHNSLFRDNAMWAFQTEYRLPVWWRFGMVGFLGIGNVHPSLEEMSFSKSKYSAGFGIRYFLVPKEGINIRLDIAFGEESSGFYLYFLEAF